MRFLVWCPTFDLPNPADDYLEIREYDTAGELIKKRKEFPQDGKSKDYVFKGKANTKQERKIVLEVLCVVRTAVCIHLQFDL